MLTIWDAMAGRAEWPARDGRVRTGLSGRPVPVEQTDEHGWRPALLFRQLVDPFVAGPARRPGSAPGPTPEFDS